MYEQLNNIGRGIIKQKRRQRRMFVSRNNYLRIDHKIGLRLHVARVITASNNL